MRRLALLAVFLALPTLAADRYIAPVDHPTTPGNDLTGTGAIGTPWRTLIKCYNAMAHGETCYLRAGTYVSPVTSSSGNANGYDLGGPTHADYGGGQAIGGGSDTSRKTFRGYQSEVAIIEGANNHFTLNQRDNVATWLTFSDLTFKNSRLHMTGKATLERIIFLCPSGDGQGNVSSVYSPIDTPSSTRESFVIRDSLFLYDASCPQPAAARASHMHLYGMKDCEISNSDFLVTTQSSWAGNDINGCATGNTCYGFGQGAGLKAANQGCVVKNNFFRASGTGTMSDAIWLYNNTWNSSTGNNRAYQNIVVGAGNGVLFIGNNGNPPSSTGTDWAYNNTIYGGYDCIGGNEETPVNIRAFNNVCAGYSNHGVHFYSYGGAGGVEDQEYWDYNNYYPIANGFWDFTENPTTSSTLASWKTAVSTPTQSAPWQPKEQGSRSVDPLFVDPTAPAWNFKLQAGSALRLPANHGRGGGYANIMGAYVTGTETIGCSFDPRCHSYVGTVALPDHHQHVNGTCVDTLVSIGQPGDISAIVHAPAHSKYLAVRQNSIVYVLNDTDLSTAATRTLTGCGGDLESAAMVDPFDDRDFEDVVMIHDEATHSICEYSVAGIVDGTGLAAIRTWDLDSILTIGGNQEGLAFIAGDPACASSKHGGCFMFNLVEGAPRTFQRFQISATEVHTAIGASFNVDALCGITASGVNDLAYDFIEDQVYVQGNGGTDPNDYVCVLNSAMNALNIKYRFPTYDHWEGIAWSPGKIVYADDSGDDGVGDTTSVTYCDDSYVGSEIVTQCSDGLDNDGDGKIDYDETPPGTGDDACLSLGGTTESRCGDNFKDPGEACDGTDLDDQTCALRGYDWSESTGLACAADCLSFVETNCQDSCPTPVNPGTWTATADSEEPCDSGCGAGCSVAAATLDADTPGATGGTFWHTRWDSTPGTGGCDWNGAAGSSPAPHWVITDMGSPQTVCGLDFRQRSTGPESINDYEVETCASGGDCGPSGGDWVGRAEANFPFEPGRLAPHTVEFPQAVAGVRYVRLRAITNYAAGGLSGAPWTVARNVVPRIANPEPAPCAILSVSTAATNGSALEVDVGNCPDPVGVTVGNWPTHDGVTVENGTVVDSRTTTHLSGLLNIAAFSCSTPVWLFIEHPVDTYTPGFPFTTCGANGQYSLGNAHSQF